MTIRAEGLNTKRRVIQAVGAAGGQRLFWKDKPPNITWADRMRKLRPSQEKGCGQSTQTFRSRWGWQTECLRPTFKSPCGTPIPFWNLLLPNVGCLGTPRGRGRLLLAMEVPRGDQPDFFSLDPAGLWVLTGMTQEKNVEVGAHSFWSLSLERTNCLAL